jgi:hypothetical protein
MRISLYAGLLLVVAGACQAADTIVPSRLGAPGKTQVTAYVSDERAVVRESRQVYLDAGAGQVVFSWTEADIDPAFLRLQGPEGLTIGNMNRVVGDDRAMSWDVQAATAGIYDLTFSYTMKGMKWKPFYTVTFDPATGKAELRGSVQINNDTHTNISDLKVWFTTGRTGALDAAPVSSAMPVPISGAQRLDQGWSGAATFISAKDIPAEMIYRLDRDKYGDGLQQILVLHVEKSSLPKDLALPAGKADVRLLVEDDLPTVLRFADISSKAGEALEIPLGKEDDLVVERKMVSTGKANLEFDRYGRVSGFDTNEDYRLTVRNCLPTPAHCELIEPVLAVWDLTAKPAPKKVENNLATFDLSLQPGTSQTLEFRLAKRSGTRTDRK